MKIRRFAIALEGPLVERLGPGLAPTAFRIWNAGENTSDDGPTFFTAKSAELLLAEQTARGRLYPSDFDHLSIVSNRPAEAGRASGYHKLEVRQSATGPELWATEIEWCADVKAGLEEQPPRWKYFSPAFKQDKQGEVFSYINFAICINPKTHELPALAGIGSECKPAGDTGMNKKAMKAFLAKMAEGATDDAAKTAYATIAAALGEDEGEKKEPDAKAEGEEKKDPPPPPASEDKKEDPKKDAEPAKEPDGDEAKKNAASLAGDLAKANAKIAALEIKGMLDARPDLSESLRKWALSQDSDTVKSFLASAPKGSAPRNESTTVTPGTTARAVGLQGAELDEMNKGMGIGTNEPKAPHVDELGQFVLHTVKPGDMAKLNITKGQV